MLQAYKARNKEREKRENNCLLLFINERRAEKQTNVNRILPNTKYILES
jgi:hypothetical protein